MSAHMLATMGLAAMQCQRASHLVGLLQLKFSVPLSSTMATVGAAAMQCQRNSHLVGLLQLALDVALPRERLARVLHRCGRLRLGLALLPPHALQLPQRTLGLPLHAQ